MISCNTPLKRVWPIDNIRELCGDFCVKIFLIHGSIAYTVITVDHFRNVETQVRFAVLHNTKITLDDDITFLKIHDPGLLFFGFLFAPMDLTCRVWPVVCSW